MREHEKIAEAKGRRRYILVELHTDVAVSRDCSLKLNQAYSRKLSASRFLIFTTVVFEPHSTVKRTKKISAFPILGSNRL